MNQLAALLCVLVSISQAKPSAAARDVHSFARPDQVAVEHADIELTVRFDEKSLAGATTLRLDRKDKKAPLVLDARELTIKSVAASSDGKRFEPAAYEVGSPDPILGSSITVRLPEGARYVRVEHSAGAGASALQWLVPEQTAGKRYPFLFTQSQAIHARSWLPLQDSPGARITYSARVRAPWPLAAIMSADGNEGEKVARPPEAAALDHGRWREFTFKMDKRIPSYLLALAVGDLSFRSLGPRTGVYSEPETLARAAEELEDVEGMLAATEKLYGPYRWGRYDVLILPPSFAYGGMENPLLTFASPTILAGDKSLVSVLAHELAHSWSGNLVTNATWRDFWLNEGFTTYVEGRVIEAIYGKDRADMEDVLGRQRLEQDLAELPATDRVLHIDLAGRDPDEGVTSVPYEKGALFLRHLERSFGRERFDSFVRRYFDAHAFRSITTEDFRRYLDEELLKSDRRAAARVPVERWITSAGVPEGAPRAASRAFGAVEEQAKGWLAGAVSDDALKGASAKWSYHERHHFLRALPKTLPKERLAALDGVFGLSATGNAELASEWLQLAVRSGYEPAYARVEEFLTSVGRGKLVKPLYKELAKTEHGRARARAIFERARPGYQAPVVGAVEKILAAKS